MTKGTITLAAKTRTRLRKKVAALRREKMIPAILYGKGSSNQILEIEAVPFDKALQVAGETTLIDLSIDGGEETKILIYDVQREPIHNKVIHTDLFRVRMDEKLNIRIPIRFIGEAKAVKEFGGILVHQMSDVEVRCLPSDLVHEIDVDITPLATFDDVIFARTIVLPKGIELVQNHDEIVALVTPPISEDELKLNEKPVEDISSVEVEKKGKQDEKSEASD